MSPKMSVSLFLATGVPETAQKFSPWSLKAISADLAVGEEIFCASSMQILLRS